MSSFKGLNIWQAARLYLTCIKSIEIIISAFRIDWWKFCWIPLENIADLFAGLLCWFALLCWSWEPLLRDFLLLDWEPLLRTSACCWFGWLDALFIGVSTIPGKGNSIYYYFLPIFMIIFGFYKRKRRTSIPLCSMRTDSLWFFLRCATPTPISRSMILPDYLTIADV